MAIEKPMTPMIRDENDREPTEVKVEVVNPDAVSVETEDGGMIIDFHWRARLKKLWVMVLMLI